MFNRRSSKDDPFLLIKESCERVFKSRYQIYDEDVIYDAMASIIFQFTKSRSTINSIEGWIVGAIHYHYIAFVKKKNQNNRFTFDELILENAESDDYPDTKLDNAYIFNEIENLANPQKEIIKLRIIDGLSYKEIAEKLNLKAATARKYFERGIINIKKALNIVSLLFGIVYAA